MTTPLRKRQRGGPATLKADGLLDRDGPVVLFTSRSSRDRWHLSTSVATPTLEKVLDDDVRVWMEYADGGQVPAAVLTFDNGSHAIETREAGQRIIQVWWSCTYFGVHHSTIGPV